MLSPSRSRHRVILEEYGDEVRLQDHPGCLPHVDTSLLSKFFPASHYAHRGAAVWEGPRLQVSGVRAATLALMRVNRFGELSGSWEPPCSRLEMVVTRSLRDLGGEEFQSILCIARS